ncbi:hypothetical protein chiPu_0027056 [Chiloscyllium punctatum]|uniref:Uncharacterized protein n=1 Tax=Chiloscyllium punctatum TaxID=137246 RepID=A0A401TJV4_CHIPU|nr:hypothetical protein [Chiloscyllium punctatum]
MWPFSPFNTVPLLSRSQDCLPAESPTTSPVIVPANENAEAQTAEARDEPEAEETLDKPSPGNTSPASAVSVVPSGPKGRNTLFALLFLLSYLLLFSVTAA